MVKLGAASSRFLPGSAQRCGPTRLVESPAREASRQASLEAWTRPATPPLLEAGRNCWRKARARRLEWLIDGQEYFSAFRDALQRASHSVFILGWDMDSRTVLVPDGSGRWRCRDPGRTA